MMRYFFSRINEVIVLKLTGKKFISLVLAALMVVSVFVVGMVSASATWGTDGNSISHIYAYFDNSTMNYYSTASSARVYMFVATSDKVYNSAALSPVTNYQSLVYKDVNYNGSGDFANVNWANVTSVFFGTASAANKPKGEYLLSNYSNSIDNFKSNNGTFSNFTASYSTGFDVSNCNALYFYGSGSSLSARNFGGTNTSAYNQLNISQSVNGMGTVAVKSYSYLSGVSQVDSSTTNTTASVDALYRSSVIIKATATEASGAFQGWYDNPAFTGTAVSDDAEYTYTVNGANTYYAKFANGLAQIANHGEGGTATVSGGGNSGESIGVQSGTDVTFTALPDANFGFDGWYSDAEFNTLVSTDDPYTIEGATTANTLYAKFSAITSDGEGSVSLGSNKNDKSRHVNSTALSSQAVSYYTDKVKDEITDAKVYQTFLDLADNQSNTGDSYTAAQGNDLYNALYNIMKEPHGHSVSYPAYGSNSLAHYWLQTDTSLENTQDGRGVYTFFYSDVDCYNHESMQREHIWPKSKASYLMATGLGGSDLHHLRPAYGRVNNIKSNWGFADIHDSSGNFKSGWTNGRKVLWPDGEQNKKTSLWKADKNGETFCDYNTDVHGDIARILLYIYTRWHEYNLYTDLTTTDEDGNKVPDMTKLRELDDDDNKNTGERIIYDRATLLKWMKEDPVSEWEMKRNDLTEDVQGNRNVFIDYPELAWLLFDQTVPTDMDTPSGMARANGDLTTDKPKVVDDRDYGVGNIDAITMDFSTITNNGKAEIKAFNNATRKYVKDGDRVKRGDLITYTIIPNQSTIASVREFRDNSGSSGTYREIQSPNVDTTYSFTRQAGYYNGVPNTTDSGYESSYFKERISVTLNSKACELSFKINSKTATGGTGGSGSGMVTAMRNDTKAILENGDIVPKGTNVTLTFTPDYGSRVFGVTYGSAYSVDGLLNAGNNFTYSGDGFTLKKITGTDSYQFTTTLDLANNTTARVRKFTVYFAQTFNSNDKDEHGIDRHIYNKGMRPDSLDPYGEMTDFTENFEICGAQVKRDEENSENKALRFISVVDKKILNKAESYGWVIGYTNYSFTDSDGNPDLKPINRNAYTLVKGGNEKQMKTIDCTGTANTTFKEYGDPRENGKSYVYITAAVNSIQNATTLSGTPLDTTIIARPYIELKPEYVGAGAPSVIYGQYVDVSTGEEFCACSGSYNYIRSLSNIDD